MVWFWLFGMVINYKLISLTLAHFYNKLKSLDRNDFIIFQYNLAIETIQSESNNSA